MEYIRQGHYTNIFEKSYKLKAHSYSSNSGDYYELTWEISLLQDVLTNPINISTRLTGSLVSTWGISEDLIVSVLYEVSIRRIYLLLEEGNITEGKIIVFDTYTSASSYNFELDRLENLVQNARNNITEFHKNFHNEYNDILDSISNLHKDYLERRLVSARELRDMIIHLVTISSAIIAGIITLSQVTEITSLILRYISLSLLAVIVYSGINYVTNVIEDYILGLNKAFTITEDRYKNISQHYKRYFDSPSMERYNAIVKAWEHNREEIESKYTQDTIQRDGVLKKLKILFLVSLIILILSKLDFTYLYPFFGEFFKLLLNVYRCQNC